MAQIINITSEALQATIRRLLPSQQGFGEDLQASNVILPIIDLTPTAEGSEVRQDLQTAAALGSNTVFSVTNANTTLTSTVGFTKIMGTASIISDVSAITECDFRITDGLSVKKVWGIEIPGGIGGLMTVPFSFVVFLNAGESISANAASARVQLVGSHRQIADGNGNLVDPVGFNPQ